MKNTVLFFALLATLTICCGQTKKLATTTKPLTSKFGALAIDKTNGYYYGFSYDQPTLAEAEKRAAEECTKRGGKGTVVLTWSGEGCGAYRTIAGKSVNDAFGWGVAKTREEADAIATRESLKRSNGKAASNFVWACNSTTTAALKTIRNDIGSFKPMLKVYAIDENGVSYLKSGDKIILSTTKYRFKKELIPGELFIFHLRTDNDFYKYINPLCIVDKNGIQKTFDGEIYFELVETYLPYTTNQKEGTAFDWGLVTVKDFIRKDKRFGGSFHELDKNEFEKILSGDYAEDRRKYPDNFSNIYSDKLIFTDKNFIEKGTRNGFYSFTQYRYTGQRTYFKTEFNNIPIQSK